MKARGVPFAIADLDVISTGESVGFSLIPDQMCREACTSGFQVNVLFVGRRGLGTSTLVNSLFAAPLVEKTRGNSVTVTTNEIHENGIRLGTTIATYHGDDPDTVAQYLDENNMDYFENERGLEIRFVDRRVYGCVFLLPLDEITEREVRIMKVISAKCNFIPVIPKADTFTPEELSEHKRKMLDIFRSNDIRLYWPGMTQDPNAQPAREIMQRYPLSVVASENIYEHHGELIRGRKYNWGFVDVENDEMSDFLSLRRILVCTFLDDLIHQTDIKFYEKFRQRCMEDADLMADIEARVVERLKLDIRVAMEKDPRAWADLADGPACADAGFS